MEGAGAAALAIGLPMGLTPMVGAASPAGAESGASPASPTARGMLRRGLGAGPTGAGFCTCSQNRLDICSKCGSVQQGSCAQVQRLVALVQASARSDALHPATGLQRPNEVAWRGMGASPKA